MKRSAHRIASLLLAIVPSGDRCSVPGAWVGDGVVVVTAGCSVDFDPPDDAFSICTTLYLPDFCKEAIATSRAAGSSPPISAIAGAGDDVSLLIGCSPPIARSFDT